MKSIRHGEAFLSPIDPDEVPKESKKIKVTKHTEFIVAHSESGHHHVLEADTKEVEFEAILNTETDELYFRLFEPAKLKHQKNHDKHKTLDVPKGTYKKYQSFEYDPFTRQVRNVWD